MSEEEKTVKEKVEELATYNFSISKCPAKVYEEFIRFCKKETNDNYAFGIKLLLDGFKTNVKEVTLFQQYMELKDEVAKIKQEIEALKGSDKPKKIKTMGG